MVSSTTFAIFKITLSYHSFLMFRNIHTYFLILRAVMSFNGEEKLPNGDELYAK